MSEIEIRVWYECHKVYYHIKLLPTDTVGKLKDRIEVLTKIKRKEQYFLNVAAEDKDTIASLMLPSFFILSVSKKVKGKHLEGPPPVHEPDLLELTVGPRPDSEPAVPTMYITVDPTPEKKLLVLDIDRTIYDGNAKHDELVSDKVAKRPHLKEFLRTVYPYYNIAIWSATIREFVGEKLRELKIINTDDYEICFYLDTDSLVQVKHENKLVETKPLRYIWREYTHFDKTNTLICDDRSVNFLLNKENGILVERYCYRNYEHDRELLLLARYLIHIHKKPDFSLVDHSNWRETIKVYMPSGSGQQCLYLMHCGRWVF